jgi:SAM-dependent methyltransferase
MDVRGYNREAWDWQATHGNMWSIPVSPEKIATSRQGEWEILLTAGRPVPRNWFPDLTGKDVLCLASGGGQQGPILAAAGANVTVFDNSPSQLGQDRMVAEREGLNITTVEGDMRDLSAFASESFDLIFHPVSNLFVPEVRPVWLEAYRVMRKGGTLLVGFVNPILYIFDVEKCDNGIYEVTNKLPYSDLQSFTAEELKKRMEEKVPLEFSHTMNDQIAGQLEAGFLLAGFYEDIQPGAPISEYMPWYFATRAVKL